jgi:hypothetical protein
MAMRKILAMTSCSLAARHDELTPSNPESAG